METTIQIYAQISKVTADTKKTQVTLDLDFDSMDAGPRLTDIVGQTCNVEITCQGRTGDEA